MYKHAPALLVSLVGGRRCSNIVERKKGKRKVLLLPSGPDLNSPPLDPFLILVFVPFLLISLNVVFAFPVIVSSLQAAMALFGLFGANKAARSAQTSDREEQGLPSHEAASSTTMGAADNNHGVAAAVRPPPRLSITRTDMGALVPRNDKLLVFRALTGIDTVPIVSSLGHGTPRTAANVGIYTRIVKAERQNKQKYRLFSILINACLGIQIIVAAILTALGAARASHKAVTAFGAINTIVAAIQTYLKGSGLPNRLKYDENEWKVIREYIEQREREFCMADCPLDVHEEVIIVEEMYKKTKLELEARQNPGSYAGGGSERKSMRQAWREAKAEQNDKTKQLASGAARESTAPTIMEEHPEHHYSEKRASLS